MPDSVWQQTGAPPARSLAWVEETYSTETMAGQCDRPDVTGTWGLAQQKGGPLEAELQECCSAWVTPQQGSQGT